MVYERNSVKLEPAMTHYSEGWHCGSVARTSDPHKCGNKGGRRLAVVVITENVYKH